MATLADCLAVLDALYDPATAEPWDAVGLVLGEPGSVVRRVVVAVDPTEAVAADAVEAGADLLLTHHPLLLRPVHGVPSTTPAGRLLAALTRAGCALHVAHTNADVARPGVSDALLAALGVGPGEPLRPGPPPEVDALVVHVPRADRERLLAALHAAGAGRLGDYERCAWWTTGTGTFRPLPGAHPAVGRVGAVEEVAEDRVELVVPRAARAAVLAALHATHPYELPSHQLWPLLLPATTGLGRVGELPEPTTLGAFARTVAAALPRTAAGVRATGDPAAPVRRVGVCGGSGGELAGVAAAAGADVLVTADLRHHAALDAPLPVLDVAHWASEWPWCADVAGRLGAALPDVTVTVSTRVTDPWTVHADPPAVDAPAEGPAPHR